MDYSSLVLVVLLYAGLTLSSSTFLPKLRRYKITTTVGRFAVPRDKLQRVIEDRMAEDSQCGNFVDLSLPQSLPREHYDESVYGEITIAFGTTEEQDLDFLPCELKETLETSYRSLLVFLPYVSNGNHGFLTLAEMTDVRNRLTPSMMTNDRYRINVDTIYEDRETVTLHIGDDEMTLDVLQNPSCHTDVDIGRDFDAVHGANVTNTCYPKRFDWNCGTVLDWDTGYCRFLKDKVCEIQRFDGDVCIHASARSSYRCPSTIRITSAEGVFGDIFSGMFDSFPVESFEAEWIDRDLDVGIEYPCLSK